MSPALAAVDWGTSSFRLWLLDAGGRVLRDSRSDEGMTRAAEAGFGAVLDRHLATTGAGPDLPVLVCGMAGARQGWIEAPYLDVPGPIRDIAARAVRVPGARDIRILPGLAQRSPHPDVMRGEETQLLGLAVAGYEGLVCMPGTHCKWARLSGGRLDGFRSCMTGELFNLLSRQSVLRHAMPERLAVDPDDPAFLAALDRALAEPARATTALFEIRAGLLLDQHRAEQSAALLSGLLIGAEVGAMLAGDASQPVVLVSQAGLGPLYASALRRAGRDVVERDADATTLRGLIAAAKTIWEFQ